MAFKEGIGENGNLPNNVLKSVDTGQKLWKPASISFMRMKNDAKKDGITIKLSGDYSAYRPCGKKGDYKERNCSTGFTQWCAWEKYKAGKGNLASDPTDSNGCSSNHGYGMAIDIDGTEARKWIRKNGEKYGWWWGEAPSESWHFTYDPKRDKFLDKKDIPTSPNDKSNINWSSILGYSILAVGVIAFGYGLYKYTRPK